MKVLTFSLAVAFIGLRRDDMADYGRIERLWRSFDDNYMKPVFGGRLVLSF